MKARAKFALRLVLYALGLCFSAFGVACTVKSNLGASPLSSLPAATYSVLLHYGVSTLSYGNCITISHLCFMLVQFLLLRRAYRPWNILQIFVSIAYGLLVDVSIALLGPRDYALYAAQLGFGALGIFFIALGVALYVGMNILPLAGDGLSVAAGQRWPRQPFHKIKRNIDCILVALALLVSFIGLGYIVDIREGTVLNALLVGPVMGLLKPLLEPFLKYTKQKEISP